MSHARSSLDAILDQRTLKHVSMAKAPFICFLPGEYMIERSREYQLTLNDKSRQKGHSIVSEDAAQPNVFAKVTFSPPFHSPSSFLSM